MLRLIDHAQRNNTIASLTAADVSRAIAAPGVAPEGRSPALQSRSERTATQVVQAASNAPTAAVLAPGLQAAIDRLNAHLEEGIRSTVAIDGRDGVAYQLDKFRRLTNHK